MKEEEKENLIFKNEVWITINEFPRYKISNFGRVKNNKNRILKIGTHRDGYKQICLRKNKKQYTRKIHRLVAIAFIPNPDNKPVVNHIDEDKTNNRVDNLEWMTIKENNVYGNRLSKIKESKWWEKIDYGHPTKNRINGYKKIAESNKKKIKAICLENNKETDFDSLKEASKSLNISSGAISSVLTKKCKKVKNYVFIYNKINY